LLAWVFFAQTLQAQVSSQGLVSNLETIMVNSESYEKYKVIKTEDLIAFKRSLDDTLSKKDSEFSALKKEVELLNQQVALLNEKLNFTQASLVESQTEADVIGFLGMSIDKGVYNALIWSLIAFLLTFLIAGYARLKHACGVVKRVKEAYTRILEEYRTQRFAATEKQMKLKRELQTAHNQIEILRQVEEQSV